MRARDGGDAGDPQDDSVRSTLPGADASLPVAVAILAAGLSRRMGTLNKLVQEVDGAPMVRRVALQVLAAGGDRVFVVLGHEAEQVRDALSGLPVGFVDNHDYREGLAASVRVAARAAQPGEALMICLSDMPQVSTQICDQLIGAYRRHPTAAAYQPEFQGRRGNPVLWAPSSVSLLEPLRGDEGARTVLKDLGDAVMPVPVASAGIFMDIDTPQALRAARAQEKFLRP